MITQPSNKLPWLPSLITLKNKSTRICTKAIRKRLNSENIPNITISSGSIWMVVNGFRLVVEVKTEEGFSLWCLYSGSYKPINKDTWEFTCRDLSTSGSFVYQTTASMNYIFISTFIGLGEEGMNSYQFRQVDKKMSLVCKERLLGFSYPF